MSIDIKNDFDTLTKQGAIAFYKTAEIVSIYLLKNRIPKNIFTIIIYDEDDFTSEREYLGNSPYNINNDLSLGILKKRIELQEAEELFNDLIDSNIWELDGIQLHIDDLEPTRRFFAPRLADLPIRRVLKAFNGSSHIIEFFSKGNILQELNEQRDLEKVCEIVYDVLEIDLMYIKDRIGNILFQFPVTLVSTEAKIVSDNQIAIKSDWHPLLVELPKINIFINASFDDNIMGDNFFSGTLRNGITFFCRNVDNEARVYITKKEDGIFLDFMDAFSRIIDVDLDLHGLYRPRTVRIGDNEESFSLRRCERVVAQIPTKPYQKRINDRRYDASIKELKNRKEFLQYGQGINQRTEALSDIRQIIEDNCSNGVYIWDPYVTGIEILSTVYFCTCYNTEIKVITAFSNDIINRYHSYLYGNCSWGSIKNLLKQLKNYCSKCIKLRNSNNKFDNWIRDRFEILNSNSNNNGINIEVRCQNVEGWKFHDRFLIFPGSTIDKPRVWSLGSSINSIGKHHSILMEIQNAEAVLNAFNSLWDELENSVIWRHPNR